MQYRNEDPQPEEQEQQEPEEEPVVFFDFLYQDDRRLQSYYAQAFRGRIASLERSQIIRDVNETTGKVSILGFGVDLKHTDDGTRGRRETVDPHDHHTITILRFLEDSGFMTRDFVSAFSGQIVVAMGTLVLLDSQTLKFVMQGGAEGLKPAPLAGYLSKNSPEYRKAKEEYDAAEKVYKFVKDFFDTTAFPSGFALSVDENLLVCGTLREDKLYEPISEQVYKHGKKGIPLVTIVGIKEFGADFPFSQTGTFLDVSSQMTEHFENMVFPPNAFRITPLVIFRKLLGSAEAEEIRQAIINSSRLEESVPPTEGESELVADKPLADG